MTSDTEQSFLEDFVFFIPKGKAGADVLMSVTVAANAIFALYSQYLSEMEIYTQRKVLERACS